MKSSARFIEMDPLAGRGRTESRSPQYLIRAMLGWAIAVAVLSDIYLLLPILLYHVSKFTTWKYYRLYSTPLDITANLVLVNNRADL